MSLKFPSTLKISYGVQIRKSPPPQKKKFFATT